MRRVHYGEMGKAPTTITRNNKLPSFYHLIKTRKTDASIQIRPLVFSLDSFLYKISWLLTQILKPLFPTFLGLVKNSHEVIHRLRQLNSEQLMQNNNTFSLDITSLYTTLPVHPAIDITSEHIISKNLYGKKLTATDIHRLLSTIFENTWGQPRLTSPNLLFTLLYKYIHIRYQTNLGGVRAVMVTVVVNGTGGQSSNHERGCLYFT